MCNIGKMGCSGPSGSYNQCTAIHGKRSASSERTSRNERGTALVEFAICLPLLTILASGVMDLGRVFVLQEGLRNAVRESAAYAALHPGQQQAGSGACADPANATWRGTNEGKADTSVTFTYVPSVACTTDPNTLAAANLAPGQPLRVKATRTMHTLMPLYAGDLKVSASVCVAVAGAAPTGTCP